MLGVDQRGTALVCQNLIDVKGLIYSPRRGYVDFTAPIFGDYILDCTGGDSEHARLRQGEARA